MNNPELILPFPAVGFLRLKQVLQFFPISKTAWHEGVKKGIYPKPIKLSERTSAYKSEDILKLISDMGSESNVFTQSAA